MAVFDTTRGGKPGLLNELRRLAGLAALAACAAVPALATGGDDAAAGSSAGAATEAAAVVRAVGAGVPPSVARARIEHAWRAELAADPHARPAAAALAAAR